MSELFSFGFCATRREKEGTIFTCCKSYFQSHRFLPLAERAAETDASSCKDLSHYYHYVMMIVVIDSAALSFRSLPIGKCKALLCVRIQAQPNRTRRRRVVRSGEICSEPLRVRESRLAKSITIDAKLVCVLRFYLAEVRRRVFASQPEQTG